jgi:alpha,alpha-trehalose phosphorylase
LHLASLAGSWNAIVAGFGGMRDHGGRLTFAPRLPSSLTRVVFTLTVRGQRLRVDVTATSASYVLVDDGDPLDVWHHGQPITVTAAKPVVAPIHPKPVGPPPRQPPGRAPGTA